MRVTWLVLAAWSTAAYADDARVYAIGAAVGPQLAITANDDVLGRVAVSGSRRWSDRWQLGVDATLVVGTGVVITEQLVEVGVWLHASKRVDVLLGWRIGHAWFDSCWNLRFGTQFEVVASPSRPQVVDARYNTFACWGGEGGNFQPGEPAGVDVCPVGDWPEHIEIPLDVRLFTVLVHELGHASGIRTEAHELFSVMGGNEGAGDVGHVLFSSEDVQLLHAQATRVDDRHVVARRLEREVGRGVCP